MQIIVSFATEEFVTPAHDEVILRLTALLAKRGITGNFHLTGDYARKLRERRRLDVINALKQHEIGYHGNTHGAFPFIAGICESQPWDDAVSILMRTEARGIMDIADIFGCQPKYYVTEFVKAPQLIYALKGLGIDLIGFSSIPGRENAPFAWYCGSLCFSAPHMGVESPPAPGRRPALQAEFDRHYAAARAGAYGGVLKIFNHPYKFIYNNNIASWVGANAIYKDFDIHAAWQIPHAAMYETATVAELFDDFEWILDHALAQKNVVFAATSELMAQYRRKPPQLVDIRAVLALASNIHKHFTYQQYDGVFYSPADIFGLVVYVLDYFAEHREMPVAAPYRDLLGPVDAMPDHADAAVPACAVLARMRHLNRELDFYRRLPAATEVAGAHYPPHQVMAFSLAVLNGIVHNEAVSKIVLDDGAAGAPALPEIAGQAYFMERQFTKSSYPSGFTGEKVCDACRRQTWTYKPAVR